MLFAVRAALPLRLEPGEALVAVVLPLAIAGWARPARIVRGVVLTAKQSDYVSAARGFGASEWYLLHKHELPQARSAILAHAALLVPAYILAEATLSFVGLGINEPDVSWGSLLIPLQRYDVMISCWWMWLPAIYLILVTGCFYALSGGWARVPGKSGVQ
jgi:peptide/nickel transport system permease protein